MFSNSRSHFENCDWKNINSFVDRTRAAEKWQSILVNMTQLWVWGRTQYPLILVKSSTYLKAWTDTPFKSLSCQISTEFPRLQFTEWDIVQWILIDQCNFFFCRRRWFWTFRVSSKVLFWKQRILTATKVKKSDHWKKSYIHRLRFV